MVRAHRSAKVNLKFLLLLFLIGCAATAGIMLLHHVRKRSLAQESRQRGEQAFDRQDWNDALPHLRMYLSSFPEDAAILRKYAYALLSARPAEPQNLIGAAGAYQRLLNLEPDDAQAAGRLAVLYAKVGRYGDLAALAGQRLEQRPEDLEAPLWLAQAMIGQQDLQAARRELLALLDRLPAGAPGDAAHSRACLLLSGIALVESAPAEQAAAIGWLDQALSRQGDCAEALIQRAACRRQLGRATGPATTEAASGADRAAADLERALGLASADPVVCLMASEEWLARGRLEEAWEALQAVGEPSLDDLQRHWLAPDEWTVALFQQSGELALRRKDASEQSALAGRILTEPLSLHQRLALLPYAVALYASAAQGEPARACLDQYTALLNSGGINRPDQDELAYLAALVARAEGDFTNVLTLLKPVTERSSSDGRFWSLLAQAYLRTGQPQWAIQAQREYLRCTGEPEAALQLARQCARQQRWNEAMEAACQAERTGSADATAVRIEIALERAYRVQDLRARHRELEGLAGELTQLRRARPQSLEARLLEARVAAADSRPEEAERVLHQAIAQCPQPVRAQLRLAELCASRQDIAGAIALCRQACQGQPADPEGWRTLARVRSGAGQWADALDALRQGAGAAAELSDRRELSLEAAWLEVLHGRRQRGLDELRALAEADPRDVEARSMLLSVPQVQQDAEAAQKLVDEIRTVQGPSGLLWRLRQASLWLSGPDWHQRRDDAVTMLQRCLAEEPGWEEPAILLVEVYQREGDQSAAETVCRRTLAANPAAARLAEQLVALLERQRRWADAQEVLRTAPLRADLASDTRVRLALEQGQFQQAIDELTLRLESDPADRRGRLLLARLIYANRHDVQAAMRQLDQVQNGAGDPLEVLAVRAAILVDAGHKEQARALLDEEVARDGTFQAYRLRAALLAAMGERALAEQDLLHLVRLSTNGEGQELLGQFYADQGRLDEAITTLGDAAGLHGGNLSLQRRLAEALLARGRPLDRQRASQVVARLLRDQPDNVDVLRLQARLLLDEPGDAAAARAAQTLERIVRLAPSAADAHLALIGLAEGQGQWTRARELATAALAANPGQPALLTARARAESALGEPAAARQCALEVLATDSDNAAAHGMLVELAAAAGDKAALEKLREPLEAALRRRPADGALHRVRAGLLHALGQTDAAIAALAAYTGADPGRADATAIEALAELRRAAGDLPAAGADLDRAERLAPRDPQVAQARMNWLAQQGQYDRIITLTSAWRGQDVRDPRVVLAAADLLAGAPSQAHRQSALALYQLVAGQWPRHVQARLRLGSLAYRMGQVDEAEQAYREALELDEANAQALNDLAWVLAEGRKDYAAALALADKGLAVAPDDQHLHDTRGVILQNVPGRQADARLEFERCVSLAEPNSARQVRALFQLGCLCATLGEQTDARWHLEQALRLDQTLAALSQPQREQAQRLLQENGP